MWRYTGFVMILMLMCVVSTQAAPPADASNNPRIILPFDQDWRFLNYDEFGADRPNFDDAAWRKVNLPHDWSIEGPFDQKNPTGGPADFCPPVQAGIASISHSPTTMNKNAFLSNSTE